MTGGARALGHAVVLLEGQAVADARFLIKYALRARRRDGHPTRVRFTQLADILTAACELPQHDTTGHADHGKDADRLPSAMVDTTTAAQILGCTPRHVRRIAADLEGRQTGGRWRFDRATVTNYQAARAAA